MGQGSKETVAVRRRTHATQRGKDTPFWALGVVRTAQVVNQGWIEALTSICPNRTHLNV